MSKVNITRNTFLEAEELSIFQQMLEDSVAKAVTLSNTTTWGIIRDYTEVEDTSFKVGTGTNVGTVKIGKALSRAVGSDGLLCTQLAIDNIVIPQDSLWYWVRVSHKYRRHEKGDVSVSLDGTLSGAGTEFTKVLRGVQSDVPTKVRFIKTDGSQLLNSGIYEVVEVSGDLVASLNSPLTFLDETNLKMIVVGATPINETITPSQLEGLYYYDDCNIEIVPEVVSDTQPVTGFIQNRTFYIARVQNNAGIVTIQDKRAQYWQPNVPGVTDRLSKFENLNDLNNKVTARTNLDVYSKGEGDARYLLSGDSSAFLLKASNLADVPDKTAARDNLDVYSKSQVDTKDSVKANKDNVIEKDSTIAFTPTQSTHPANKEYVDSLGFYVLGKGRVESDGSLIYFTRNDDRDANLTITTTKVGTGRYTLNLSKNLVNIFVIANVANLNTWSTIGVKSINAPYEISGNTINLTLANNESEDDAPFFFTICKLTF